jgi:hypothetical protein
MAMSLTLSPTKMDAWAEGDASERLLRDDRPRGRESSWRLGLSLKGGRDCMQLLFSVL